MTPQTSQIIQVMLVRRPAPALAYGTKPTQRQTGRTTHEPMRYQTRNVIWDPSDSGNFAKREQIGRPAFARSGFFDFRISLMLGHFCRVLANITKPTIEKTPKNRPIQTPTTGNAPCLESTTFRVCVRRGERGMSFGLNKTVGKRLQKSGRKAKPGMSFGISNMIENEGARTLNNAPCMNGNVIWNQQLEKSPSRTKVVALLNSNVRGEDPWPGVEKRASRHSGTRHTSRVTCRFVPLSREIRKAGACHSPAATAS